jgi:hypothetical protein
MEKIKDLARLSLKRAKAGKPDRQRPLAGYAYGVEFNKALVLLPEFLTV